MNDPQIISAIIQSAGGITATIIAAITASVIGKKFSRQSKLKEDFNLAKKDIEFLLSVEDAHCQKHKEDTGESYKNRIRDEVKKENGLSWSKKFTPGRV